MTIRTVPMLLLAACVGCSDAAGPRSTPTAPTPPPPGPPPLNRTLQGIVLDGNLPLAGAAIEITSGFAAGRTTTSGADGRFDLGTVPRDAGDIVIRASRDGHRTVERHLQMTSLASPVFLTLTLEPIAFANIAGQWTLTVESSPSCDSLPAEARLRRYTVSIEQSGALATAHASSASMFAFAPLAATVYPSTARFQLICGWGFGCLTERLSSGQLLDILGTTELAVEPRRVSGYLNGAINIYQSDTNWTIVASCERPDHKITFER